MNVATSHDGTGRHTAPCVTSSSNPFSELFGMRQVHQARHQRLALYNHRPQFFSANPLEREAVDFSSPVFSWPAFLVLEVCRQLPCLVTLSMFDNRPASAPSCNSVAFRGGRSGFCRQT